jgi:sulfur carrier protein ThiS adenylyltransferase
VFLRKPGDVRTYFSYSSGWIQELQLLTPKLFDRNVPGTYEVLHSSVVGIAGCGGLGSNAAMALTRAGIGNLIIVDFDSVEESNLSRQHFFQFDIGKKKVAALSAHIHAVNPDIHITACDRRLSPGDVAAVFKSADILIEAFDQPDAKAWLIESWRMAYPERPVIGASGLSGIGGTESLKVRRSGNLFLVGDGESNASMGLCAARVAMAANMEANIAIELLMHKVKMS